MTAATRLVAAVDVAQESSFRRVSEGSEPALRVELGLPVRVLAFVGRDPSYAAAARAGVLGAGAELALITGYVDPRTFVERAVALREARPDVVLVAGDGADTGGMADLLEALRYGRADEPRPRFLLAGEARLHERIAPAHAGAAGEALPDLRAPDGRLALVARLRGLRRAAEPVVLRDEAVEAAARALAGAVGAAALVVDVHGASTSLALATPAGAVTAVHTRLGVGSSADRVAARAGLERVRRWIPQPVDAPALLERIFNRARWPDAVPAEAGALTLEMALAREVVARALDEAARCAIDVAALRAAATIACTGRLARLPRPTQTVLVALDGLAPEGVTTIVRERPDELIAAGALAARGTSADVDRATEPLAIALAPAPRRGASVRIVDDTGAAEEPLTPGGLTLVRTAGAVEAVAGPLRAKSGALAAGVVIDARGRPLALPPRDAERLPVLARWHAALAALPDAAS